MSVLVWDGMRHPHAPSDSGADHGGAQLCAFGKSHDGTVGGTERCSDDGAHGRAERCSDRDAVEPALVGPNLDGQRGAVGQTNDEAFLRSVLAAVAESDGRADAPTHSPTDGRTDSTTYSPTECIAVGLAHGHALRHAHGKAQCESHPGSDGKASALGQSIPLSFQSTLDLLPTHGEAERQLGTIARPDGSSHHGPTVFPAQRDAHGQHGPVGQSHRQRGPEPRSDSQQ